MQMSLSVVIPAYNEEENVAASLKNVEQVIKKLNLKDYEIILVNDGSKDRTGEIAKSFLKKIKNLKVVENKPNRGYGGALKAGYMASTKEFIVLSHADNQFDFSEVEKLISKQAETNADIVAGIREGGGADPIHRKLNRWGWNSVVRALFGYLATDIDSGFKLFRRSILEHLTLPAERGAMIDTQFLAGARARGYIVAELPVTHLPRTAGKSTGANLHVIIQSFIDLFKFWFLLKNEILVERGLAVFKWEALSILLIIIVAGFVRLQNITGYMTFLGDEGRDAIVMADIVTGKHLPLIGPGTSIGSMYLGPLFYYFVAPSLALANFSPVGPAIEIALLGLATIGLLWWWSRQMVGRVVSLSISLLYALAPTAIIYSRSSWNPNIMPFFALLCMYAVWKVWRFGYWRWLVVAGVSLAMVLNSHYLGLLLVPVVGVFLLLSKRKNNWSKYLLVSAGLFAVLMSPLLFFDLRHNWQNSQAIAKFFTERQTTVNFKAYKALPVIGPLTAQIFSSLITAKNDSVSVVVSIAILLLGLVNLFIKKTKKDFIFILSWFGFGVLGLALYKQHIYDHYFGFLFPAIFLLLGFALRTIWTQKIARPLFFVALAYLLFINVSASPLKNSPNYQLSRTLEVANDIYRYSNGQPFNLALVSKNNYDASYRYGLYLNKAQVLTPHEKITDQLFVVCEVNPCEPINNPLWEIAAFGWAKVDQKWEYPWGVTLYKLIHNPLGQ